MTETPKPPNYEYSKKIKYKDIELEVIFKIDSDFNLEIFCLCENGLNFTTKKFNTIININYIQYKYIYIDIN